MNIYEKAIKALIAEGKLSPEDRILVSCGGDTDARYLKMCGLKSALISNVDDRRSEGIGGYDWQHCDAEALPFADESFDWGFVHAGLHHCMSPHKGFLELLRVSRKGVLVIEARDSLLMRLAIRLGFVPEFEIVAVAVDPEGKGGVRNTSVPNFIYRWTESEVRKTVESAYPHRVNDLRFFYGLTLPVERFSMYSVPIRLAFRVASVMTRGAFALLPKQGNQFAFAVLKSPQHKPWIDEGPDGPRLSPNHALGFNPDAYVKEEVEPV